MGLGDHPKTFLLKALCCQCPPSWVKVVGGGGGGGWVMRLYCQHWDCFDSRFSIPSPSPSPSPSRLTITWWSSTNLQDMSSKPSVCYKQSKVFRRTPSLHTLHSHSSGQVPFNMKVLLSSPNLGPNPRPNSTQSWPLSSEKTETKFFGWLWTPKIYSGSDIIDSGSTPNSSITRGMFKWNWFIFACKHWHCHKF